MNKTSDVFNKNSVIIGTNTLQTPNTKEYYKVIHNTFYNISKYFVLCIYIIIYLNYI